MLLKETMFWPEPVQIMVPGWEKWREQLLKIQTFFAECATRENHLQYSMAVWPLTNCIIESDRQCHRAIHAVRCDWKSRCRDEWKSQLLWQLWPIPRQCPVRNCQCPAERHVSPRFHGSFCIPLHASHDPWSCPDLEQHMLIYLQQFEMEFYWSVVAYLGHNDGQYISIWPKNFAGTHLRGKQAKSQYRLVLSKDWIIYSFNNCRTFITSVLNWIYLSKSKCLAYISKYFCTRLWCIKFGQSGGGGLT